MPGLHHIELWVTDIDRERSAWGWVLERLGFTVADRWAEGESWSAGGAYLTLTTSPTIAGSAHDRRAPGVNHLAFRGGRPADVDRIMSEAPMHGWHPLYHDRYPHAGGPAHYAGWLENSSGHKIEIVAEP